MDIVAEPGREGDESRRTAVLHSVNKEEAPAVSRAPRLMLEYPGEHSTWPAFGLRELTVL